ncbi:RNA polymerase sigma factor [Olivibacter domesticus]|uniref:RNA polymerase sigma factor, sigma-70 family n=1 Tax=Olivibacter domesticus TaxID=407022 RepID=A0A1H7WXR2_OLID1|nr:sigma-70 family RNA polymerase sigma factor [Olivibacter domesticus]SEM25678.1 RNA polymerase sigma factor, sigma-70 family [Olivibacter domesticus]
MDLKDFWKLFVKGDKDAFRRIYEAHSDALYAYGINLGGDHDQVLDCIHDLFVHLYGNHKISENVNIRAYLLASLRRRLFKLRKTAEETVVKEGDVEVEESAEVGLITRETEQIAWERLKEGINRLPKRQREILHLRYTLDLSYPEVAKVMNINIETCRKLSYRAIKLLKADLETITYLVIVFSLFF